MRRFKILTLFLVLFFLIGGISKMSQGFGDGVNIQTSVIEGFEKKDSWVVKFSKFRCRNWNNEAKEKPDDTLSWISWKEATPETLDILPDGLPREKRGKDEKTIMGAKACFDVKGYNWVVLEPKTPLIANGVTKAIDMWVWSSGYDYDIYLTVKSWKGFFYSLYMGNLSYYGWKNLRAEIPGYISQDTKYVPRVKPIQVVRIKLISSPHEKADGFYIYFDYMQTQTDIYVERYSGDALSTKKW